MDPYYKLCYKKDQGYIRQLVANNIQTLIKKQNINNRKKNKTCGKRTSWMAYYKEYKEEII
jgi:hypothetical protein